MCMPSHRWPKRIFTHMLSSPNTFRWYQEVQRLRDIYKIDLGVLQYPRPQDINRQIISDAQRYEDMANIDSGDMPYMPVTDRDIWIPTAESGKKELMAMWLRDSYTITGQTKMDTCIMCSQPCSDWLSHILQHCTHQPTQVTRGMIKELMPTSDTMPHTWLMSRDHWVRALLLTLARNWITARQQK